MPKTNSRKKLKKNLSLNSRKTNSKKTSVKKHACSRNVVADVIDFRDKLYIPTLIEVRREMQLANYLKITSKKIPVLDQKTEGSCTGFALATVAHFLLRTRKGSPDHENVSPHMIYELAKKYDEWSGTDYSGSNARGAIKAWHKHGICSEALWSSPDKKNIFDIDKANEALNRPLGAYFRVNNRDIVAMHSAISETGILYATLETHTGWDSLEEDGIIEFDINTYESSGGHAVAIIGYDKTGFWLQNSWGKSWGKNGYGLISYNDWLTNGWDVWAVRLGVPIYLTESNQISKQFSVARSSRASLSFQSLRPHIISIGNNGLLEEKGTYSNDENELEIIFKQYFPEITKNWKKKRILLYAHGGLTPEETAVQRLADNRNALLENEIFPIYFIWHTSFWDTLRNILEDTIKKRKSEGFLNEAWNFVIEKTDRFLEAISSVAGEKVWNEMKENGMLATTDIKNGGNRKIIPYLNEIAKDSSVEIHIAGHSAGSIFLAPFIQLLSSKGKINSEPLLNENGYGNKIGSVSLWAPAITTELFKSTYMPLINSNQIEQFNLFILDDKTERDDNCCGVYRKSLLYLVSNSYEKQKAHPAIKNSGESLLGMEKWINNDNELKKLIGKKNFKLILSPESNRDKSLTNAKHHGDFDDDEACLKATLASILKKSVFDLNLTINRSAASLSQQRNALLKKL
ncbi:MAG: C1 family peptidase [Bacteroidota bacterium]|nr:C1 family peptidase [Bacteroidota bacterium]